MIFIPEPVLRAVIALRKWIVCSAWPYVNTIPHLGTFIHLLSADVFSRYLKLKGDQVISVTGSDEHGTPIEVEAIKAGVPPKTLTDKYHRAITALLEKYRIDFTNYTRTENPVHIEVVQSIFRKIYENGYVIPRQVELPYCNTCIRFLPDRFVEGVCPYCSFESARGDQCDNCGRVLDPLELKSVHCVFCGSTPTVKSETHWFFDLPQFTERIRQYLDSNPQLPDNARNFSYRWLDEGLKPRAITRSNKWGIPAPFPGAEGKTIYVWHEAVLGYVTAAVEWARKTGQPDRWKEYWFDQETRNIHFIGKDNIPFHTIMFPSLLMATKDSYVLPWQVSSTEFMLYESQKFSKSRKIGVWIDETLRVAEPDYWRFVLIAMRPEGKDANFTWDEFRAHVNADLNDAIGNFIHRTLKFIESRYGGVVPEKHALDDADKKMLQAIRDATDKVGERFEEIRLRDALTGVVELARTGNQYLSSKEPWHTIKTDPQIAATTLHVCAQAVFALAVLLAPFTPSKSELILKQMNAPAPDSLRWEDASALPIKPSHKIGDIAPLFSKIDEKELAQKVAG